MCCFISYSKRPRWPDGSCLTALTASTCFWERPKATAISLRSAKPLNCSNVTFPTPLRWTWIAVGRNSFPKRLVPRLIPDPVRASRTARAGMREAILRRSRRHRLHSLSVIRSRARFRRRRVLQGRRQDPAAVPQEEAVAAEGAEAGRAPSNKLADGPAQSIIPWSQSSCHIHKGFNPRADRSDDRVEIVLVRDERRGHSDCGIGVRQTVRTNTRTGHDLDKCAMFQDGQAQDSSEGCGRFR